MILLYCIIIVMAIVFALNMLAKRTNAYKNFYRAIHVVKDVPAEKKYSIAAFGSTFAYYAYDLKERNGHNFSIEPQSVTYLEKTVNHFLNHVEDNGIVLLSLAGCFFAADSVTPDEECQTYYSFLSSDEFVHYKKIVKIKYLLKRYCPVLLPYFVRSLVRDVQFSFAIDGGIDEKTALRQAQNRIHGWEKAINKEINTGFSLDEQLELTIEKTTMVMARIVDAVVSRGMKPVFVVLPMSCAFQRVCPKEFYEQILYKSLENLKDRKVLTLDYLYHEELSRLEYYMTADCLNASGRKLFTQCVMEDLGLIR